jgi:hypothetical protein
MEDRLPIGDRLAASDQTAAVLGDIASILGAYRRKLIAAGFQSEEALDLCRDVQDFILGGCE